MSSPVLDAALGYAELGWPVFKLKGKRPAARSNGFKDATTDRHRIGAMFRRSPRANLGIATGAAGLAVLDVDPRHSGDESLQALEQAHEPIPQTVRARTGGGGEHIFFKNPGDIGSSAGRLGPGLDVRGNGGYVVAPPSTHESGNRYEWINPPDEFEVAEAPAWLLALCNEANAEQASDWEPSGRKPSSAILTLLRDGDWPIGEQRSIMLRVTRALLDEGRSTEDVVGQVFDALERSDQEQQEPWTRVDVEKLVADLAASDPPSLRLKEKSKGGVAARLEMRSLRDAEAVAAEPIDWIVPGLIAAGEKIVIAGPPKSFKTWLALSLCRAVALGEAVLGEEAWKASEPQPVIYVQEEGNPQRWAERLVSTFDGKNSAPFYYAHRPGFSLLKGEHLEELSAQAIELGARLIILDPYQRVTPGVKENDASDSGPAWDAIHELARSTGAAVVVVHHSRKDTGPTMDAIRGTSRIAGEVDLMAVLKKVGNARLEMYLDGRDLVRPMEEDGNLEISYDPERPHEMRVAGRLRTKGAANATLPAVISALTDAHDPLSTSEVVKQVKDRLGESRSRQRVTSQLDALVDEGKVEKVAGPKGKTTRWRWIAE
jgi:hypothetical protein